MQKIRKVVIPAAGFGTRFLPQTKAMPKEMLPIVDKPVIQYVVEEAIAAGIEDVVIVTGALKRAIEDHFDVPNAELLNTLEAGGKTELLKEVREMTERANFLSIRQKGMYGTGTAVLCAEPVIENETFVVMWGDEFLLSTPPRLSQMIRVYERYGGAVISAMRIQNKEDLSRYGIADVEPVEGNIYRINHLVEKPQPGEAPSNLATIGAYILPPDIFAILRQQTPGKGGEIWLSEAIAELIRTGYPVYACEIEHGRYYDTGNKLEYLKAVVELALQHPNLHREFKAFLKALPLD
jgi:UTP--glucose-1-phosphate uridylyltransferase